MRRKQTLRTISVFLSLFLFLFSYQVYASGAQRPDLGTEAPVITEDVPALPSEPADNEGTATTPKPPTTTPTAPVSSAYSHLDPQKLVPRTLFTKAIDYYDKNQAKIKNKNYVVVIDFKQHNSKERFYLIDMESGHVETYLTAHGKGSDPNYTGYSTIFSNQSGSNASSLGFYLTAETYFGSNGYSLKLDGLSPTNSNARSRAIVIHGAEYVTPGSKIGRSWGCPALDMRYYEDVIDTIKGGVLIYAERS